MFPPFFFFSVFDPAEPAPLEELLAGGVRGGGRRRFLGASFVFLEVAGADVEVGGAGVEVGGADVEEAGGDLEVVGAADVDVVGADLEVVRAVDVEADLVFVGRDDVGEGAGKDVSLFFA